MINLKTMLLEKAQEERAIGGDLLRRRRPSGEHSAKAEGLEYAAGAFSGRVDAIMSELARVRVEQAREPLDCQERDEQLYRDGQVAGLLAALDILGIEVEDEEDES